MTGPTSLAVVDCPTGLAGNMLLAALFDLGLPQAAIDAPLAALGLAGAYAIDLEERRNSGLRGLHLAVRGLEAEPPHRHWAELEATIAGAALEPQLKQRVLAVFGLLISTQVICFALVRAATPPERVGRALSAMNVAFFGGAAIMQAASGVAASIGGIGAALMTFVVAVLICCIIFIMLRTRKA